MSTRLITLRLGDPGDLPAVERLERASFADPWPRHALMSELAPSALRLPLVLEDHGQVVGYLMAWRAVDQIHVLNVAVSPAYRRRGLGRRLIEAAVAEARRIGASEVTLEVRPSNTAALALYRTLGFVKTGFRPRYYADTGEDALVLTYALGGDPPADRSGPSCHS